MNIFKSFRAEAGDTIVEVMIAILVASVMLVAAYASTNHNTKSMQDAQERGQALKLAETQVEFLRNKSAGPGGQCFTPTGGVGTNVTCKVNASGAPTTVEPAYNVNIAGPGANGTYTVTVTFKTVYGTGNSVVTMLYRPEA